MSNPPALKAHKVADADLSRALCGVNGRWLRSSLALADRTDPIAFALDAALLVNVLCERAAAQMAINIGEREQRDARFYP